jgi:hypothetical protein
MRIFAKTIVFVWISALVANCLAQGGQIGRMGRFDGSVSRISSAISTYLNGREISNVLTPGEFSEMPLALAKGQVVVAEARSDAFDPALEIVDSSGAIRARNDDRYPGDQRPLLFWRCPDGGAFSIHVRCFHDRSGGQFHMRFNVYDSVDLTVDKSTEQVVKNPSRFLFRIPMKAGEIKQVILERPSGGSQATVQLEGAISPLGLPDIDLADPIQSVFPNSILAPVSGDYYAIASSGQREPLKVRATTRLVVPTALSLVEGSCTSKVHKGAPALWGITVKSGQILRAATSGLPLEDSLVVTEQPDVSHYDLAKPETDPFFPKDADSEPEKGPAIQSLVGRARDARVAVFEAKRDTKLWLATSGAGGGSGEFALAVQSAPKTFPEGADIAAKLRIGDTDYWAFDARVGDVMAFKAQASGFSAHIAFLQPDLNEDWSRDMLPDQTTETWNTIVQRPGRYLVAVSCVGDGGGGDYSVKLR